MQTLEKFDSDRDYPRHPKSHKDGGIHLTEQAAKVTEVGLSIVKKLGVQLKEGSVLSLLKMSRPAIISNHLTFLQCAAKDWVNSSYLNTAAATTDPLERMKWVITFFVSAVFHNPVDVQNNGPLNPILGETYYAEKKDGTKLYCEQISHHPPVFAYLVVGPNKSWRFYGTGEVEANLHGINHIFGKRIGETTIEFADGGKISYTNPDVAIDGLLVGDRRINYINTVTFTDKVNKLTAEINFQYEYAGSIRRLGRGLKRLFKSKKQTKIRDAIEVVIYDAAKSSNDSSREVLFEGSGSWVSHLEIDGQLMWKLNPYVDDPWIEDIQKSLPSDSLFRTDAKYIKVKNFDAAQREKDILENRQRDDEKLRKAFEDKIKKEEDKIKKENDKLMKESGKLKKENKKK